MGIFTEDGKLQTGWATGVNMAEQRRLLGIELRRQGAQMCNPVGTDLTWEIFELLETPDMDYVTDILIQADDTGKYQAVLLGGREKFQREPTFHVIYLCSIAKGMGADLLNKVKADKSIQSITLEPVRGVEKFYEDRGFEFVGKEKGDTMIWRQPKGGKRTRRKKLRKSTRRRRQ